MDIPVITYDVTLGGILVGTFTNEPYASKAVEFIGAALKAGAIFAVPADAPLMYAPTRHVTQADSVAAAEASGLTVDYDTIVKNFEGSQGALLSPAVISAPAPIPSDATVQP